MNIELILSPDLYDRRQLRSGHAAVAVDVLRATTAICAAFSVGADAIVPLDSLESLPLFAPLGYEIAAERNGSKLPGATCGNSPTEYLRLDLRGRRIAYSTTNGTVSILRAVGSKPLYVGAFANLSRLASALVNVGSEPVSDLVILCSGWKGDPSIEDTLFAGALIERVRTLAASVPGMETTLVNDPAMMALDLWRFAAPDAYAFCSKATHVHRLRRLGYDDDIRFAFRVDSCPVLPQLLPNPDFPDGCFPCLKCQ